MVMFSSGPVSIPGRNQKRLIHGFDFPVRDQFADGEADHRFGGGHRFDFCRRFSEMPFAIRLAVLPNHQGVGVGFLRFADQFGQSILLDLVLSVANYLKADGRQNGED